MKMSAPKAWVLLLLFWVAVIAAIAALSPGSSRRRPEGPRLPAEEDYEPPPIYYGPGGSE